MLKAIIIEDEARGISNLTNMLRKHCPEVQIVGIADDMTEGKALLADPEQQPDLAFLDIKLSDGLVFDLLNEIPTRHFDIIFVSGYPQHGVKATWYNSSGFIMKPIDPDDLKEVVQRVVSKRQQPIAPEPAATKNTTAENLDKISFSAMDGVYFRSHKEILRFVGNDNYTNIHFTDGTTIVVSKTMKTYDEMLVNTVFFRVHKQHIINLNYITKYNRGEDMIKLTDGTDIPLSRRRKADFFKRVSQHKSE